MNYKKLAMLPISLTISFILPVLVLETGLYRLIFCIDYLKRKTIANDAKSLTFLLPCLVFVLLFFNIEILRHILSSNYRSFKKKLILLHNKLNSLCFMLFVVILSCYIMKMNDEILLRHVTVYCMFLTIFPFFYLFGTSQLTFMISCSLYIILCLMLCFSYIKYFAISYNMLMAIIKRY